MSNLEGYGKIYESTNWGVGRDNSIGWGIVYKDLGISTDADYQAVLDRSTALGYTAPSAAQQELQNTLVTDLKSAGIWDKLDLFYIWATDGDVDFAGLNWITPSSFEITRINSPNFTTNVGFQGVIVNNAYLSSGYIPTSHAVKQSVDSTSYGYYLADKGVATSSAQSDWGSPDVVTRAWYRRTALRVYINSSTYLNRTTIESNDTFIHVNRSSATEVFVYHNGVEVEDMTSSIYTTRGLQGAEYNAFKRSATYADSTLSMAFVGASLNATEASAFNTAVQNYLNAI